MYYVMWYISGVILASIVLFIRWKNGMDIIGAHIVFVIVYGCVGPFMSLLILEECDFRIKGKNK